MLNEKRRNTIYLPEPVSIELAEEILRVLAGGLSAEITYELTKRKSFSHLGVSSDLVGRITGGEMMSSRLAKPAHFTFIDSSHPGDLSPSLNLLWFAAYNVPDGDLPRYHETYELKFWDDAANIVEKYMKTIGG